MAKHLLCDTRDGTWYFGELEGFPQADKDGLGIPAAEIICMGTGVGRICIPVSGGRCYDHIETMADAQSYINYLVSLGVVPVGTPIIDCDYGA